MAARQLVFGHRQGKGRVWRFADDRRVELQDRARLLGEVARASDLSRLGLDGEQHARLVTRPLPAGDARFGDRIEDERGARDRLEEGAVGSGHQRREDRRKSAADAPDRQLWSETTGDMRLIDTREIADRTIVLER